jgi:CheY-like chemotaxis protein
MSSQSTQVEIPCGYGEVILLVEDEQNVRGILQTLLERLGYQILMASNGRAALEVFDQQRDKIALVLTDITMPEMDGLTLAQILRQQNPAVKIVLLTGYPLNRDREAHALVAQGMVDAWLEKPVSASCLAQTVSLALK